MPVAKTATELSGPLLPELAARLSSLFVAKDRDPGDQRSGWLMSNGSLACVRPGQTSGMTLRLLDLERPRPGAVSSLSPPATIPPREPPTPIT